MNNYPRCYHSHPALPLKDGLVIFGGSCSHPAVDDADVYVGFDYSQGFNPRSYPWNEGVWFNFPIVDMKPPSNPKEFSNLIDWLILQLSAKKKVHIGCIGGHGRTGTVMAALVARFLGVKDAIAYVRKNYCEKAVESQSQIDFLVKHFGVSPAEPSKAKAPSGGSSQSDLFYSRYGSKAPALTKPVSAKEPLPAKAKAKMTLSSSSSSDIKPMKVSGVPMLWGPAIVLQGNLL